MTVSFRYFLWIIIPVTLMLPLIYIISEVYFISAFINTLSTTTNFNALTKYEWLGKAICAFGLTMTYLISNIIQDIKGNCLYVADYYKSVFIKKFILCFIISLILVKLLFDLLIYSMNNSNLHYCGMLSHIIKQQIQFNNLSPIYLFSKESEYINISQFQVSMAILPYSICTNSALRDDILNDSRFTSYLFTLLAEASKKQKTTNLYLSGLTLISSSVDTQLYSAYLKVINSTSFKRNFTYRIVKRELNNALIDKVTYKDRINILGSFENIVSKDLKLSKNGRKYIRHKKEFASDFYNQYLAKSKINLDEVLAKIQKQELILMNSYGNETVKSSFEALIKPRYINYKFIVSVFNRHAEYTIIESLENKNFERVPKSILADSIKGIIVPTLILTLSVFSILMIIIGMLLIPLQCFSQKFIVKKAKSLIIVFSVLAYTVNYVITPSNSEKVLLNNNVFLMKAAQYAINVQYYTYPKAITFFKYHGFNPWLPHHSKEHFLNNSKHYLKEADKKLYLLSPIHKSVAWHALVLSNHSELTSNDIMRYKSRFDFYKVNPKYEKQMLESVQLFKTHIQAFN